MAQRSITFTSVVDLSHTIDADIPLWPGDPPVRIRPVALLAADGYHLRELTIGEHSGTHMNAPNTFEDGAAGVDAYGAERRVVSAVVIDARAKAREDPDHAFREADLLEWEAAHGEVPAGSVVILYTGWQERWGDPAAFFGEDPAGGLHFPGFSAEVTRFLLDHRGIAGVGIDTHSVDPGQDVHFSTNRQVLARGGVVLECLANLDRLPPAGATLVLGALRIKDGTGTPLSVMAFVP